MLLWSACAGAHALGLGDINLRSGLGQPLRADIALRTDGSEAIDSSCFKITGQAQSPDDVPWLGGARIELRRGVQPYLRLTTGEPLDHPILMLGIKVACGFEVSRQYTLLLEPVAVSAPISAPAPVETLPAPSPRTSRPAPPRRSPSSWQVVEGETLASIAATIHPGSPARQRRFIAAAAQANPDIFPNRAGAADQALADGTVLKLSSPRQATPRPATESRPPPRKTAKAQTPPPARQAETGLLVHDRLSIGGATRSETGLKLSPQLDFGRTRPASEAQRDMLRQEQRLLAALEDTIVQQLTVADKIKRLEEVLARLQRAAAELDQRAQAHPIPETATPMAEEAPASPAQPATDTSTAVSPSAPALPAAPVAAPATTDSAPAAPPPPTTPPTAAPTPDAAPAVAVAAPSDTATKSGWSDWLLLAALGAAVLAVLFWLRVRGRQPPEPAFEETAIEPRAPRPRVAEVDIPLEREDALAPARQMPERSAGPGLAGFGEMEEEHTIHVAEHESAMELAEIMLSFGRVQGAAQTLADYIEANPKQAVRPWLRLLELYRDADMRAEFETMARRMNQSFNIETPQWDAASSERSAADLEDYPHVMERVIADWGSAESLEYLHRLLQDNRNGTRIGFPVTAIHDVMVLIAVLEEFGLQRPEGMPAV